jgi:asparagine synthase (glutamine-hydrolysing)
MHSPDGRYSIVYNGEIYNYRELRQELTNLGWSFKSETDTEVLIASWAIWRDACLSKLEGMFAFVVLDRLHGDLNLVRDAFGIKPLFYLRHSHAIYFASEIPALLKLLPFRLGLNLDAAYRYLLHGKYDNGEDTFYERLLQIKPGHKLSVKISNLAATLPTRWWWPTIDERTDLSITQAADQIRELFLDSVRLNLRSDVAVGAALSGGIDSSSIVCAMRHLEPRMPIHTFSYVALGSLHNEEKWVDLVNSKVGAISHKVAVTAQDLITDVDDLINSQGEPFGGTSIYAQYKVFKLARENGISVTLDGQGADELLAGYNGYPSARLHSLFDRNEFAEAMHFLYAWSTWPGRSFDQVVRMSLSQLIPASVRLMLRRYLISEALIPNWLDQSKFLNGDIKKIEENASPACSESSGRRLVHALRSELTGEGLHALLRHGDRNSMRWSVESRVPFLTTNIAEFLLRLPERYLLSPAAETKHVFRLAMRGIVPDAILDRRDKIGFATPELVWIKELSPVAMGWLKVADQIPFLNAFQTRTEIQSVVDGKTAVTPQLWRLINYCKWASQGNVLLR